MEGSSNLIHFGESWKLKELCEDRNQEIFPVLFREIKKLHFVDYRPMNLIVVWVSRWFKIPVQITNI